jgi:hypothetical protein
LAAATSGLSIWSVDLLDLSHPEWFRTSAVLAGVSSAASTLGGLTLPSRRDIEAVKGPLSDSGLHGEQSCEKALARYADAARTHRYISGLIDLGTGAAHLLVLSPYGKHARGDVWDYLSLASGIVKILFGLADFALPTPFERDYGDALLRCGAP